MNCFRVPFSLFALSACVLPVFVSSVQAAEPEPFQMKKPDPNKKAKRPDGVNLAKVFEGKALDSTGTRVPTESLATSEYVVVYYTAQWNPSCRNFTPKLVEFMKEHRKAGKLDVVMVSADRDEKAMLGYMKENGVTWGAAHAKTRSVKGVVDDVEMIPHLRVFDKYGKVVLDTDYDENIYPTTVLKLLKKKLAE